jgi:hypothetical protein
MSARKRSRGRGLKTALLLVIGGLVFAGGAYLVWFSDVFTIRAVDVIGGEYIGEEQVNLTPGGNILFWEPDIDLEKLPKISGFSVEKDYLERKVIVSFGSRDRYAIWCLEGKDECFWVDDAGVAFSGAPDLQGPLIFRLVRDSSGRTLSLGDKVLDSELFVNLIAAFNFLDEIDAEVQEFRIEDFKFKEAVARTKDGPDIYFSLTLDPHFGLGVVRSLRQSGEWDIIRYLDLRVPNRAYYSG